MRKLVSVLCFIIGLTVVKKSDCKFTCLVVWWNGECRFGTYKRRV